MNKTNVMPIFHNILDVYNALCKPFCKERNLPQTLYQHMWIASYHADIKKFFSLLYNGIDPSDLETFRRVLDTLAENVLTAKDSIKMGDLQ